MSYDYNALVEEISKNRLLAAAAEESTDDQLMALQAAMDAFAKLSSHCPMTPRLWMQYAYDAAQFMATSAAPAAGDDDDDGNLEEVTAAAISTRLNILELGWNEFPGCAMLQFHYLELLAAAAASSKTNTEEDYHGKFQEAFRRALALVGTGSHRNEDTCWIVNLYRLGAFYFGQNSSASDQDSTTMTWYDVFVKRSQTPMQHGNEGLMAEFLEFASQQQAPPQLIATIQKTLDENRRSIVSLDLYLARFEEEVDVALQAEGILARPLQIHITACPKLGALEHDDFWKGLWQEPNPHTMDQTSHYSNAWMGLGGAHTARAFIRYAQAMAKYRLPKAASAAAATNSEAHVHKIRHHLAMAVYERGVAECPTVEALWLAYLNHVVRYLQSKVSSTRAKKTSDNDMMTDEQEDDDESIDWDKYQSVALRATRNCPYSVPLMQQRMKLMLLMANAKVSVLDPDSLMTMVQEALGSGFIIAVNTDDDESGLELYLTAIRIVQRRILFLLTKTKANGMKTSYDDASFPASTTNGTDPPEPQPIPPPLDVSLQQEIQDLCDDLRDMYETADQYFRPKDQVQHEASARKARFVLWKDRSRCERDLLGPCEHVLQAMEDSDTLPESQSPSAAALAVLACHDQWIRRHQPAHPDSYASYIEAVRTFSIMTMTHPSDVIIKLQWIRALYQKGLAAAAGANATSPTTLLPTAPTASPTTSALWSLFGRDYELALREFCQDYLEFEHLFGSDESYEKASQAIFKKRGAVWSAAPIATNTIAENQPMEDSSQSHSKHQNAPPALKPDAGGATKVSALPSAPEPAPDGKKRARPDESATDDGTPEPVSKKKLRVEDDASNSDDGEGRTEELHVVDSETINTHLEVSMDGMQLETPNNNDNDSTAKVSKKQQLPKVRIGKLEYPAHPFTVRVSNLSPDTEDMDLVDVFRPRCGPVVHAKIICDKHPPHKSKGWGLIQFEDREAVDKALALHDVIGINERLAQVERSHMPAATLVPPGKHRVKPKGQGKSTKRNEKRKTGQHADHNTKDDEHATADQQHQTDKMDSEPTDSNASTSKAADKQPKATAATAGVQGSVFAFRPRNLVVGHKNDHRKVKLALDQNADSREQL